MKDVLKEIANVLAQVAEWIGFRGTIIFEVDVDTDKNDFRFKTRIRPEL